MSIRRKLRTIVVCAALELGVLSGVPVRPEEVRALMHQMNQPKVAHILRSEDEQEPPPRGARGGTWKGTLK